MITMITGPKAEVIRKLLKNLLNASSIENMIQNIKDAVSTTDRLLEQAVKGNQSIDAVR